MTGARLALLIAGLGFLALFSLGAWLLSRKVSLDVARNKGVRKASNYLTNPILAIDYAVQKNIDINQVEAMVNKHEIKAYSWGGHLFVESD